MTRTSLHPVTIGLLLLVGVAAPLLFPAYTNQIAVLWLMIVFASTWDILGGQMGYNSLGNILVNPHAGLIFIDFALQARLRVNGTARVLDSEGEWRKRWPQAERAVEVIIQQVYWNCPKRIPRQPL